MAGSSATGDPVPATRPPRRRSGLLVGGATALAVVLGLLLGLPVIVLLVRAIAGGNLPELAGQAALLDALSLSLATTLVSVVIVVVLGTPLAYLLAHRRFPAAALVETVIDLPIVLPPSVAGLALLLLFGRRGPLGAVLEPLGLAIPFTTVAVVLAQVFVAAPFFVRSARGGFQGVQGDLEDAARVDGADEAAVIRHVSIPLALPAIAAGLVMCWARALGEFGATIMFAGNVEGRTQTLPLFVYSEFQASLDASVAAAAVLVFAALGVLLAVRVIGWTGAEDRRRT